MKMTIGITLGLLLLTATGCWFSGTTKSPDGGTLTEDEGFSFVVPTTCKVNQGEEITVTISLNRGGYFKQDVTLLIEADGITIAPNKVIVRANDAPNAEIQIIADKDSAIGMYRVLVNGKPKSGKSATTHFTVEVVAQ